MYPVTCLRRWYSTSWVIHTRVEGSNKPNNKAVQVMGFANNMHKIKCIEITKNRLILKF